ncbi:hypothetical protein [Aliamphritea spongicola]|uniref:hypothetical protein n=1 Tax=Aliamphritea spongicola TaxID=707589 RepID=UPI00196A2DAF|nr:hypothetical protein [Aliamphritea spongicola]MBN3564081.1 hypothetical protein [Aliamphritea spongicola]
MDFPTSEQAQFPIPAAIITGYGILFSTFITLILIPAMTMISEDLKQAAQKHSRYRIAAQPLSSLRN